MEIRLDGREYLYYGKTCTLIQDERVKMHLVFTEFMTGTIQILVSEDESDVILTKFYKIIKSIDDVFILDSNHHLPFEFQIDLSSQNVKSIKVTAIMTSTQHFDKEGWILQDQSYLHSLLHGMKLGEIRSPLQICAKQSPLSTCRSWPLKCPITVGVLASTEPSHSLFSLVLESQEEVIIESIDVNVMNGIVGAFQEGEIVLRPNIKHHWSFGISFLDNSTKLIVNFDKENRQSQHVPDTNNAVLNIQIHLKLSKIKISSHWVSLIDFSKIYNSKEPLKTLESRHGKNFNQDSCKEPIQACYNLCQIFFSAPLYIYTRRIFSIQVYIVNTSSKERNFILKIPNQDSLDYKTFTELDSLSNESCIVCLEDAINIHLLPHKSSFLNLHFVALKSCTSWIKKIELYDIDKDAWIDLVDILKITTI